MSFELKIIEAVGVLEKARKSLAEAISIHPENDFLDDTDTLIQNAIIILKTSRYERPNNKDCLNCSNSFGMKGDRLICMVKQKAGKTVRESIVLEDGYCDEWN
jgi:hypothetical protein